MEQQTLTEQKRPTQKEQVLQALVLRPDGVCGTQFLEGHIPRYAARILDLKHDGHRIKRVSCPYPFHNHPASVATYKRLPNFDSVAASTAPS